MRYVSPSPVSRCCPMSSPRSRPYYRTPHPPKGAKLLLLPPAGGVLCVALVLLALAIRLHEKHIVMRSVCVTDRAGTNTPSDEYDTYRKYRVANTNMYSRIHFFSEAKLGNGLSVLVYACTMYSAQKFHFANLVYYRYCLFYIQV